LDLISVILSALFNGSWQKDSNCSIRKCGPAKHCITTDEHRCARIKNGLLDCWIDGLRQRENPVIHQSIHPSRHPCPSVVEMRFAGNEKARGENRGLAF
jgi:hypothetical protein